MLKAMEELEKSINDLLDRTRKRSVPATGLKEDQPAAANESGEIREQEAAELVRRAIKRLKTL